ncbi:sulfurtransferase TusA family protein [Sutterella sp.]|uniref:sulfurtransferase TusA family protein n=1 Tax=Sutterella sp. TaxID=1981025 RepID=UPI0026E10290|nr:sulfurtransferase TusA family protein [Sutterella sp.]MDO5532769.1 sulfurtransferase TusA family protein [Sutterella sp.]
MTEKDFEVTDRVDITDVTCPITFVKAKVALDGLDVGDVLEIKLNGGEPLGNVPRSFEAEGQKVLAREDLPDGTHLLWVKKLVD